MPKTEAPKQAGGAQAQVLGRATTPHLRVISLGAWGSLMGKLLKT